MGATLVGGISDKYQKKIPVLVDHQSFAFPSVRGGIIRKIWACWKILWAAKRLKNLTKKSDIKVFLTNTPRTHFVLFIAKRVWRMKGKWIAVFHDFTTRPDFFIKWDLR